ncbi:T9SS type A sorting domain-containing protein [Planktosalinus lacus]|uniref:Secretion system C-terminal sorting domain-containing protein n=1 Tax=Planktosalinus lacus TaxID=1526573 RepID=A0A8J2V8Q3_9FLAO|nr:T9SS type A sorting domain-containing protein [Planktosalinus lacus]GGD85035.1 hypothetical protein GCM10011312_06380 [Planktosalinus lacus]
MTVILCVNFFFAHKLYAQDPILFEHTWYLEKVFDGEDEFYIADYTNYTATTEFFEEENYIFVKLCDFDWLMSTPEYFPNNEHGFTLTTFDYNVFATDSDELHYNPDFSFIRNKMFTVFFEWPEPVLFYNPFTYTFTQTGNEAHLVIENVNGKKAYYNSFPLSTQDLQEQKLVVYPNPVQEKLFIYHLKADVSYSAKVYNLNGNKLFDFHLKNSQSQINLQSIKQGIYFLVIESENGMKFTEKIIKR